jgi:predicted Holliday junction resolvase-like endonuclease
LKGDVDTARQNEKRMSDAFKMLNAEMKKSKDTWKRIQTRLVVDVEQVHEENSKFTKALENRHAAMEKLAQERDAAVRRHPQAQEELGPLWMELSVATKDLQKVSATQNSQQREIDCLMVEFRKKTELVQANLKRIMEKF